ncbi:hypothetical protein F5882DRAFT_372093 [Hyaloscypha sp. PMI_1271]|nr:hypothetical protein F5882DRAFT_372093 [Hyaloscypha sp. PMI_1271]
MRGWGAHLPSSGRAGGSRARVLKATPVADISVRTIPIAPSSRSSSQLHDDASSEKRCSSSPREPLSGQVLLLRDTASFLCYFSAGLPSPKALESHTLFPAYAPPCLHLTKPPFRFSPLCESPNAPAIPTAALESKALVFHPRFDNGLRIVWATQASLQQRPECAEGYTTSNSLSKLLFPGRTNSTVTRASSTSLAGHLFIPWSLRLLSQLSSGFWDTRGIFVKWDQRINLVFMLQELGRLSYPIPDDDPTLADSMPV